jgi:hypothetical protein
MVARGEPVGGQQDQQEGKERVRCKNHELQFNLARPGLAACVAYSGSSSAQVLAKIRKLQWQAAGRDYVSLFGLLMVVREHPEHRD